ncbi:hypothetical protein N9F72_03765 [Gammaproteobacteria bacterium]|nr:hypothetical protein [Gammaproteobacteria bacterium]
MSIADRLGLVSHWAGFITGAILSIYNTYDGYEDLMYVRTLYDNYYVFWFGSLLVVIAFFVLPLLLGWLIRYILSGKVHILPFK